MSRTAALAASLAAAAAECTTCAYDGARSYTCAPGWDAAASELHHKAPHHRRFAAAARGLADGVAGWVRDVLGETEAAAPLTFAYYSNPDDSDTPCRKTAIPPMVPHGGGDAMCDLIEASAAVGPEKGLGTFLVRTLDLGCAARGTGCHDAASALLDWQHVKHTAVAGLGITPYQNMQKWGNGSCPGGVYSPDGACRTVAQVAAANAAARAAAGDTDAAAAAVAPGEYYGMSGGGGSGAGFDVYCEDPRNASAPRVSLLGGGGGGGSGASSPQQCAALNAGGGGGGGVYIPKIADIGVGGGGGHNPHDPPTIGDNFGTDPDAFAAALKGAADRLRACKAKGHSVTLRGGGGGGGGFEAYLPFNMTDCAASPKEAKKTFGYGYGFQFAMGAGAQLEANAANGEDVYVECPAGHCTSCVEKVSGKQRRATKRAMKDVSKTFACADAYAKQVCAVATAPGGERYTAFNSYALCNCPVSKAYLDAHLPDDPAWAHLRTRPCVFKVPGADGLPSDNSETSRGLPELTLADLKRHAEWHAAPPKGCLPLLREA